MANKDLMTDTDQKFISPIGYIHTDFPEKFGIPRQSTLVEELTGTITFEEPFTDPAAIRGIEEYSHLWLLWGFSGSKWDGRTLTVHPPRLGGKEKRGVFATRSPFRPNGIGLSCVKLERVGEDSHGAPVLYVSGIDMMDGTPIYDIKPYMPYSDSFAEACGGFGQARKDIRAEVIFPEELLERLPDDKREAAVHILEQDPRAAYNKKDGYVYGLSFAGYDIRFVGGQSPDQDHARIEVCDVIRIETDYKNVK